MAGAVFSTEMSLKNTHTKEKHTFKQTHRILR